MHSILTVSYCLHSEKAVLGALFSTNLMPSSNFNRNLLWKRGNMACGMNTRNRLESVPWACLDCSSHKESHLAMLMKSSRSASQKSGWEVGSLNCALWVNAYFCYRYTLNRFELFFFTIGWNTRFCIFTSVKNMHTQSRPYEFLPTYMLSGKPTAIPFEILHIFVVLL